MTRAQASWTGFAIPFAIAAVVATWPFALWVIAGAAVAAALVGLAVMVGRRLGDMSEEATR